MLKIAMKLCFYSAKQLLSVVLTQSSSQNIYIFHIHFEPALSYNEQSSDKKRTEWIDENISNWSFFKSLIMDMSSEMNSRWAPRADWFFHSRLQWCSNVFEEDFAPPASVIYWMCLKYRIIGAVFYSYWNFHVA